MRRTITVPIGSTVRVHRGSGQQPGPTPYRTRPPRHRPDLIYYRNDSGETAPAFGILRVTGAEASGDGVALICGKPSTTLSRHYLINGPVDVADDGYGYAYLGVPKRALYDTGTTPAYGEGWGPKPSEWELFKGYPGFTIFGNHDSTEGHVLACGGVVDKVLGKTDASHAKAASGTVSVYIGTAGSESDSTINVTAYNKFADVATTMWVWVEWSNNSWYLTAAEC